MLIDFFSLRVAGRAAMMRIVSSLLHQVHNKEQSVIVRCYQCSFSLLRLGS